MTSGCTHSPLSSFLATNSPPHERKNKNTAISSSYTISGINTFIRPVIAQSFSGISDYFYILLQKKKLEYGELHEDLFFVNMEKCIFVSTLSLNPG
jgi:hypothetical protein